ncbi:Zn-dependent hydrolase [Virgibacillus halodenitrificans]|uniref:Zn-dependent hydrolase n=1 Tax=Virgibacillus halodenitrificans TaxID=1482 RepID=A0ABR7VPS9_VIRHA|nr:Zn-dependent hydrolase [Virgibacillus halodenitrificans]MBD1222409.1 Zn-dependent hydrolase [Virgibacillus halodenitrificans]
MVQKHRYQLLLDKVNQYNSGDKGITRIAYTDLEQTCTHAFMRLCIAEGMEVRLDPSGNMIARRQGRNNELPPVLMGSHLDTVYQGGRYDGTVGVTAALEVVKRMNEKNIITEHPIEIISFACEESARFGVSTLGSKAMTGALEKEKYRHLKDRDGITVEKAFSLCALDYDQIDQASRADEKIKAFFELHVEQGPVLLNNKKKIGIVTGIAAPIRFSVKMLGKASHSGTTPMNMRKDALLGAAELSLELERAAKLEEAAGTVATIGYLNLPNGAMNIVPGEVELKIDIRSTCLESRQRVAEHVHHAIAKIQAERELDIETVEIASEEPVQLSAEMNQDLVTICEEKSLSYQQMHSGAGHDAMNMTTLCPVGLIFVPSVDGLSHHPNEFTELDDILAGIDVLEEAVVQCAGVAE